MAKHDLPVMDVLPQLRSALSNPGSAILVAPPGAGKTTAVPLALLEADWLGSKKIILLVPRRLASRSAAARMASALGQNVGETVGYRMRFDTKTSSKTRIEIVTEGVFHRMILDDPQLSDVGCVIFDEFHERSLDSDFGLALTLDVRSALRDDLRLLIMSATLDSDKISTLLPDAPVIRSQGRMYPVSVRYMPRKGGERLEQSMANAIRRSFVEEEGSILAFLPGAPEIRATQRLLENRLPSNIFVVPLFGAMDIQDQATAIGRSEEGFRKVVLATSIAESSVTIEGVRVVIDSGMARVPDFDAAMGVSRLLTKRASKASIAQRAGRAGRTAPGVAIRLWQEEQTAALADFEAPEILQADLSSVILHSAEWGVSDLADLSFLDPPPQAHVMEAKKLLVGIGALTANGKITDKGRDICRLGMAPRLASMVVAGTSYQDRKRRALLALLITERGLGGTSVDLDRRLEHAWREKSPRANAVKALASRIAGKSGEPDNGDSIIPTGLMLCDAYPDRIAKRRQPGSADFLMANGRAATMDDTDPLAQSVFIVVADMAGSAQRSRILSGAAIDEKDVLDKFSSEISETERLHFDSSSRRLRATRKRKLGEILISSSNIPVETGDKSAALLADAVRDHGLGLLDWSGKLAGLRNRLAWLHKTLGADWPDVSDRALSLNPDLWLQPFLNDEAGLDRLPDNKLSEALMSLVPYNQHHLVDELAPSDYVVPTGSKIALTYLETGEPPILSVRVQELFGMTTHPAICGGKIPLSIEMLSPAQRPIQITRNLPEFWNGSWVDMRKDMRGRYPKHEWPENPAKALPVRGTRKPKQ